MGRTQSPWELCPRSRWSFPKTVAWSTESRGVTHTRISQIMQAIARFSSLSISPPSGKRRSATLGKTGLRRPIWPRHSLYTHARWKEPHVGDGHFPHRSVAAARLSPAGLARALPGDSTMSQKKSSARGTAPALPDIGLMSPRGSWRGLLAQLCLFSGYRRLVSRQGGELRIFRRMRCRCRVECTCLSGIWA